MSTRASCVAAATFLCLALGLSACGGGGPGNATTEPQPTGTTTNPKPRDDPEVAGALDLFVQAAGRGDAETMWGLLSRQSRSLLGPTLAKFEQEYAKGFEDGLGSFATTEYDVVLSQVTPSGWGIAAIAGTRTHDGKNEFAAYAVPVAQEGGGWRLELGDPIRLELLSPDGKTTESQPEIAFRARAKSPIEEAGVWVDGEPVPGDVSGSGNDIRVTATPGKPLGSGRHVVVAYVSTGETAMAGAAPFRVTGAPSA